MGKTAAIKVSLTPATTSQKVSYSVEGLNGYISVNSSGVITAKKTKLFNSGAGTVVVKSGNYSVRINVKTKK